MKKRLSIFLVLMIMVLSLSASAFTTDIEKGYISVNESKTEEIQPNQAEITIGIETSDKNLKDAVNTNKNIANNVYSSLKPILNGTDYLKTGEYTAKPEYSYTKDQKKIFDKYTVTNTVVVKTRNIQIVSKIIDTAIAQGATNVEKLQFTTTDYSAECTDALAELTKTAYSKANKMANAINYKVSGIKYINTTCNSENNNRNYFSMMAMKDSVASSVQTPIESGKLKLYANIDASFYVSKK